MEAPIRIIDMPDDQAVPALRAADPDLFAQFSDDELITLLKNLRQVA